MRAIEGEKIEYDCHGLMKYNPSFHDRQNQPWSTDEVDYLVNWYNKIDGEEMSLALGRTINVVRQKVNMLRKKGIMPKATFHARKKVNNQ